MDIKKIVPVVAAGTVVVGMTSMTAYAADATEAQDLPAQAPEAPAAEEQHAAQSSGTEIKSITFTDNEQQDAAEPPASTSETVDSTEGEAKSAGGENLAADEDTEISDGADSGTEVSDETSDSGTEVLDKTGDGDTKVTDGTDSVTEITDGTEITTESDTAADIDNVQNGIINVDENGGSGSVEITTRPPVTTEETTPSGDPVEETVTNPDGSTTTTTTTPTDTTTTTTEETEISGSTEGSEEVDTSTGSGQEEAGSVEEDIKDALGEAETNEKNVFDWNRFEDAIKDIHPDAQVSDNADGSRTHTVTFTTPNSESRPDHLSANELGILLGVTVSQNEDGGYFYTREDGTVVNLAVEDRSETTSNAIRWTVTVQETYAVESGSEDVGGSAITPDTPPETPPETPTTDESAADVLNKVTTTGGAVGDPDERGNQTYHGTYGETEATVTKDTGGNIVKVVVGTKTYEFTYTSGGDETVSLENLSDAQIRALLPEGYTVENGVISKDGYTLNLDEATTLLRSTTTHIGMTVTDSTLGSSEAVPGDPQGAQWAAEKNAVVDAVLKAIKGDGISRDDVTVQSVQEQLDKDTDGDHSWEVTIKAGGKTYIYTVTSTAATQSYEQEWNATKRYEMQDKLNPDGTITEGKDTTYTGHAYVSGEKIVWSEEKGLNSEFGLKGGKVDLEKGDSLYNAIVMSVTQNEDGTTTVVTQNGDVFKTYVFAYSEATDEDYQSLLTDPNTQKVDWKYLNKVTWTVKTETRDTTGPVVDYIGKDDGLSLQWSSDGTKLTFTTDEGSTVLSPRGDGTYSDDKGAVYTIEKREGDSPLSGSEIVELIQSKYGEKYGLSGTDIKLDEKERVATFYTDDGTLITINYPSANQVTYIVTKEEQSTLTDTSLEGIKDQIRDALKDSASTFYIGENEIYLDENSYLHAKDKDGNIYSGNQFNAWFTQHYGTVDFSSLSKSEISNYLQKLQTSNTVNDGSKVTTLATGEYAILDGAELVWSDTDDFPNEDMKVIFNNLSWIGTQNSFTYDLQPGKENQKFYKLTGKVAYDFDSSYGDCDTAHNYLLKMLETSPDAQMVKVLRGSDIVYYIYRQTADLVTYGYKDTDVQKGILNLKLKLTEDGKATASSTKYTAYQVNLEQRTESRGTHADLGTSTSTTTTFTNTGSDEGYEYFGRYRVTETPDVREPVGTGFMPMYRGDGTAINESYTLWHPLGAQTGLGAVRTDYSGTLGYTYLRPDAPVVTVRGEKDLHRNIAATVTGTSVTTRPGAPIIDTVTRPAPVVPDVPDVPVVPETPVAPIAPTTPADETDRAPSAATPATATDIGDTQTPQAETPASTPAQPQLANLPDAQTPTAQAPVNTVSEIADSVVPLAESIDSGFTLLDASVPLSDIPNTGDGFQSGALDGILAAAGLGLIALRKKDESEE